MKVAQAITIYKSKRQLFSHTPFPTVMKLLVLVSLLIAAESAKLFDINGGRSFSEARSSSSNFIPNFRQTNSFSSSNQNIGFSGQGNSFGSQGTTFLSSQGSGSFTSSSPSSSFGQGRVTSSVGGQGSLSSCPQGQVLHVDGRCVAPEVTRNYFSYTIPSQPRRSGPAPILPPPKVEQNVLFVHLPENQGEEDPIVIPPPQQKNVLFLLNKNNNQGGRKVISFPQQPQRNPDVFFVNYNPGENPTLPGGIDLNSALSISSQGSTRVINSQGSNTFGNGQSLVSSGGFGDGFSTGVSSTGFGNSFSTGASSSGQSFVTSGFGPSNNFGQSSVIFNGNGFDSFNNNNLDNFHSVSGGISYSSK